MSGLIHSNNDRQDTQRVFCDIVPFSTIGFSYNANKVATFGKLLCHLPKVLFMTSEKLKEHREIMIQTPLVDWFIVGIYSPV